MRVSKGQLSFTLALLFAINFMNFYDRQVLGAIGEQIKNEWHLSDSQLAGLTTAFVLLYAVVGIPLGRLADVGRRKNILAAGVVVWSLFTALSGLAGSFAMLVVYRLGVGVGEASAAPTANSLIGDLFPARQRARAISIFMLGLPLGFGASYLVSGLIAKATGGWRPALFVAAVPGFVLGALALLLPEPKRGAADPGLAVASSSQLQAIRDVLRIRTMWWIIASGALFNLNMYALGAFNTSFLIRYHLLDIDFANRFSAMIYGVGGGVGMLLGGWLGDRVAHRADGPRARMRVASLACLIAAPLFWLALQQPRGAPWNVSLLMLAGCISMYTYYSTVYATIHDIVAPQMRGTAMAVYFLVFYLFTAIGLMSFGRLSDGLTQRARLAGASAIDSRALGLHDAMYVIPAVLLLLVVILWSGSRTVEEDHRRLQATSLA
ncbi:MAG: MFS transporter [Gemmatimonadaceae bacterium]